MISSDINRSHRCEFFTVDYLCLFFHRLIQLWLIYSCRAVFVCKWASSICFCRLLRFAMTWAKELVYLNMKKGADYVILWKRKKYLNDKFASSKVARFLALDLFFSLFSYWFWHNEFIFVYFCLSTQCMVALDMRWYDIINCLHAKARSMHTIYIAHSILCVSTIPVLFSVVFFFFVFSDVFRFRLRFAHLVWPVSVRVLCK